MKNNILLILVTLTFSAMSFAKEASGVARVYDMKYQKETSVVFISGQAAKKMYKAMKSVSAVNMGAADGYISSKQKVGTNVTCNEINGEVGFVYNCEIALDSATGTALPGGAG